MKSKLILLFFFPLLLCAQQKGNIHKKESLTKTKKSNTKPAQAADILKGKKTMTSEELSELGIELPGAWFTVNGNIKGIKDSTQVSLSNMNDGKILAQGHTIKGLFKLHGQVEHEGLNVITFDGYKEWLTLFMANDSIAVTGDVEHLGTPTIKGAAMEDDFIAYRHGFDTESEHLAQLLQAINTAPQGSNKDSLTCEYKEIVLAKADSFFKQKPASPVSCFILFTISGLLDSLSELDVRFNKLLPDAKKGFYAELIKRKINENKINVVGTEAPDFTQNNTADKPFSLHSLRGKYVLLYFWASWCKPCRTEIPRLVSLYNQYKNRKFEIVGVSLDMEKDNWVKAITDDKIEWIQVSDLKYWDNDVAKLYKIESIPQNLLLDTNGLIIGKNLTPDDLQSKLGILFK